VEDLRAHAVQPAPHAPGAPAAHGPLLLAPVTLDIDLASARVSVEVRL
ncbi:MAG: hypothetical protein JSS00_09485, partial [Proteobacteria bacterium]|nr:hypothetical protein [Pseudomonadota bacterium]